MVANLFELNTIDVLGSGYRSYLSDIRALSLTNPRVYFLLRKELSTKIVDEIVSMMYKTVFKSLTAGQTAAGAALSSETPYGGGASCYIPNFPSQKANIIGMRIAEILESELSVVVETLMPLTFDNVASNSLSFVTRSKLTHDPDYGSGSGSGSATASTNS